MPQMMGIAKLPIPLWTALTLKILPFIACLVASTHWFKALKYLALFRTKPASSVWQSFRYLKTLFMFLLSLLFSRHIITTLLPVPSPPHSISLCVSACLCPPKVEMARTEHHILGVVWSAQYIVGLSLCPLKVLKIYYWRLRYFWDYNILFIWVSQLISLNFAYMNSGKPHLPYHVFTSFFAV